MLQPGFGSDRRGAVARGRLILLALLWAGAGCATTGPATVQGDRFNFNKAGAASTNEQILLNIVRLRYGEPIYFVDIGSMLSHYSLAAGGKFSGWRNNNPAFSSAALNAVYGQDNYATRQRSWEADLDYTDSPTITYQPMSGDEFARRVMTRIPVGTILELAESGWDVERLFACCIQRINGATNKAIHGVHVANGDYERFRTVARLLQAAQDAQLLRFAVEVEENREAAYLYTPPMPEAWQENRRQFRRLLDLPADCPRLRLTTNSIQRQPDEMAMQTRSVLGTMYALAQEIDIPAEQRSRCQPATAPAEECPPDPEWLRVKHSPVPQAGAFVQVFYRGYWFFIDDSDWSSKRTLSLLAYLFALQSSARGQSAPLITVPAGK